MDSNRSSALPRPGIPRPLSKLPAPRSLPQPSNRASTLITSPQPTHSFSQQPQYGGTTNATRPNPGHAPARTRNSVAGVPSRTAPTVAAKHAAHLSMQAPPTHRQPLSGTVRPQAPQARQRPQSSMYGSYASARAPAKQTRYPSQQQENEVHEPMSSGEESISPTSVRQPSTPVTSKKARPSLSERTIESLSHTPASTRRSSSFFGVQSPTSPQQRSPSAFGNTPRVSSLSYSRQPSNGLPRSLSPTKRPISSYGRPASPSKLPASTASRPSSPFKRPTTGYSAATPARTPSLRANPVPTRSAAPLVKPHSRQPSTVVAAATAAATAAAVPAPSPLQEPAEIIPWTKPAGSSRPTSRAHLKDSGIDVDQAYSATHPESVSPKTNSHRISHKSTNSEEAFLEEMRKEAKETKSETKSPPASAASLALREQIAKAKANARAALKKEKPAPIKPDTSNYDFETDDPFNTKPKDGKDILRKRINDARRDGRLNISGLSLAGVPDEVLKMYDSEAIQAADMSFSDVSDLTRFNAADNEITDICDGVFPDGGSQFGGLDTLDLHGNLIPRIPLGLRRLERLTTLNLSRNKLDNWCFDIIAQLPTVQHLYLAYNDLNYELPESIGALTALETLSLENNKLTTLPASIERLSKLRVLRVSNNRLSTLPMDALAKIPSLVEVSAASNAIVGALFPSSVAIMEKLQALDVSHNAIASLAFGAASRTSLTLPALVRLDVSANRLGSFPDISKWTNLAVLTAEENALSDMPAGMTSLRQNLRSVNLERNELRSVDVNVAHMEALETLQLGGNPLRAERKLLTMGAAQIKQELSRKLDAA